MARSVHCVDDECDDCHSLTCSCSCHDAPVDGVDDVEADEWDEIYGWGDDG